MAIPSIANRNNNRLLAAIPQPIYAVLQPHLKEVTLKQRKVLFEPGDALDRIYFPQNGMISLLIITTDGAGIEAATIGREGAVGLQRGLGKRRAFTRATVQVGGTLSVIEADRFEKAVHEHEVLRNTIATYTEVLLAEAQQIAACNALHTADARLARWLLQTRDRIESAMLPLTQEFLAQMLGVRRTTVTLVAGSLQAAGLIEYRRGRIEILDAARLEDAACECYGVMQHQHLPGTIGIDLHAPA